MSAAPLDPSGAARSRAPSRRRRSASGAVPHDATSATVVIDEVLHDGGLCVVRGRTATAASLRIVAPRRVVGTAPQPGETWTFGGVVREHCDFGAQFDATTAAIGRPSGALVVQAIARGRAFPGIGAVRAQRLWDRYGVRVFDLLDAGVADPFAEELGADLAAVLVGGWRTLDQQAKAYRWMVVHGVEPTLARKIIDLYAELPVPEASLSDAAVKGRVVWHLEDDPYRLLAFAPWRAVDRAARRMGVAHDDPRRMVGAAEAVLAHRLTKRADTWMPADDLHEASARLLGLPLAIGRRAADLAVAAGAVVTHAGGYQGAGCAVMERFVAERCAAMREGRFAAAQTRLEWVPTPSSVAAVLDAYEREERRRTASFALNDAQRAAVWMAVTEPLSCLVGGPGVGKTTVLKAVHRVAEHHERRVVQAALSGRAAQRMEEATGRPASTIAALLVRIERGDELLADEPLVIVDEASMVDLASLYRLLRALEPGARLLLVGDPGQLAPVSFGLTFHVLAEDGATPRTTLKEVMRQTAASGIPRVCEAIRAGRAPALRAWDDGLRAGVSFVDCPPSRITERVVELLASLGGVRAAQVVGSTKSGPGTVGEINSRLHALASLGGTPAPGRFFLNEPVVATRNDYDIGVMNGELGTVLSATEDGGLVVRFDAGEKTMPAAYLDDLELAFAITCHKAQGSQFPRVIVPVTANRLLDRTLLLTAVSRAEEQVILVGDRAEFDAAVRRASGPSLRLVGLGR